MMQRSDLRILAAAVLSVAFGAGSRAEAGLVLTVEKPGVQETSVEGVTTETFDEQNEGYFYGLGTAVGKIVTSGRIQPADQYGGAGGVGQYLTVNPGFGTNTLTLLLDGPQAFFGFWWSAADQGNNVDFYSEGNLVGHFDSSATLAFLDNEYYGNPTKPFFGKNSGEPYAYLNIFGTDGTTIDQVVFTNTEKGTGFEMDNWSTRGKPVDPFPGTPIPGGLSAVPEPGSFAMIAIGGAGLLARRMRKRNVLAAV